HCACGGGTAYQALLRLGISIQTDVEGLVSQTGFLRASFSFFGANPAVIISALSVPMAALLPFFFKHKMGIFLSIAALVILSIGIYISGTRTAWLMVVISSLMLAYFYFRFIGVGAVVLFWGVITRFLPTAAWNLLLSIYTPLTSGQFLDTSMEKRFVRQQTALDLALQHPLGVGWTGSGWVHGDFTQVAANLGILAGIVFLAWYLSTLYRAIKKYRQYPRDGLFQVILTSFVLAGVVLATEGVQVLPQYAMPVWFVWGLMEAYLQVRTVHKPLLPEEKLGQDQRFAAHF
ncbi:MAG: O-antigen ligase family protein, partial [Anaerolineae bacterium]